MIILLFWFCKLHFLFVFNLQFCCIFKCFFILKRITNNKTFFIFPRFFLFYSINLFFHHLNLEERYYIFIIHIKNINIKILQTWNELLFINNPFLHFISKRKLYHKYLIKKKFKKKNKKRLPISFLFFYWMTYLHFSFFHWLLHFIILHFIENSI